MRSEKLKKNPFGEIIDLTWRFKHFKLRNDILHKNAFLSEILLNLLI